MAIDPDDKRNNDTTSLLNAKFAAEAAVKKAELAKANRSAALQRARDAKKAKKEGGYVEVTELGDAKDFATITTQIRDEQVWREAMVAQMIQGRCVSSQQLDKCAELADAYLKIVKERFPG